MLLTKRPAPESNASVARGKSDAQFSILRPVFPSCQRSRLCLQSERAAALDELLERHVQALGGRDKINAVHSVVQHLEYREGSFVIPDAFIAQMRPYYKTIGDPRDKKIDINEGYDGSAWEYYADPGVVIRTVGAAAAATRHGTEIIDSLVEYRLLGTRVELAGRDTFAGQPAYKLHVTLADGFEQDIFIDPLSFLIVGDRRSAPIHAFGQAVRSENRTGDYRPVNGVLFPFSVKEVEIATGREMNSNTIQSIVVNEPLDPSFFSPPQFQRTPLQQMLEQVYAPRTPMWIRGMAWSSSDTRWSRWVTSMAPSSCSRPMRRIIRSRRVPSSDSDGLTKWLAISRMPGFTFKKL
jgi:hypothetical protein